MKEKSNQKLQKIFAELENMTEWFQGEDIDIDEALKKCQQGIELVKIAKTKLKEAENEFKRIKKELEN